MGAYFPNGFALDADGRVALGDADIASVNKVRPVDAAQSISVAVSGEQTAAFNAGQGVDGLGKMLYADIAGGPMPVGSRYVGGIPYTDAGALVVDTSSPIHNYVGGVPMTLMGAVAASGGEAPIIDCYATALDTEQGFYLVTESGLYLLQSRDCLVPPELH
jgi:hypothetical protein